MYVYIKQKLNKLLLESVSHSVVDCSLPGSSVHGFPRQKYWSGLPIPSPGDLPDPGIEPGSTAGRFFTI